MRRDVSRKATPSQVEPLPVETVHALADAVPARYRALVILAAGSGMRQGECPGLTVDRLDFLRRVVHVDRQLVTVTGRPSFLTAPKTAASVRTIRCRKSCSMLSPRTWAPSAARRWVRVRHSRSAIPSVAPRSGMCGGLPSRPRARRLGRLSSVAAFLCQLVDQAWRVSRPCKRGSVTRRRARRSIPTPTWPDSDDHPHAVDSVPRGLCADWGGGRWT